MVPWLHFGLASALEQVGDLKGARAAVQQALALDPNISIRSLRVSMATLNTALDDKHERVLDSLLRAGIPEVQPSDLALRVARPRLGQLCPFAASATCGSALEGGHCGIPSIGRQRASNILTRTASVARSAWRDVLKLTQVFRVCRYRGATRPRGVGMKLARVPLVRGRRRWKD